ncbi:MAG: hypothetical protein ABJZ55_23515, partial [Fuerstiella sp.]
GRQPLKLLLVVVHVVRSLMPPFCCSILVIQSPIDRTEASLRQKKYWERRAYMFGSERFDWGGHNDY